MERRQYLTIVAGVGATTLAGCSGTGGGTDTSSPEAVVESYYTISDSWDQDTSIDDISDSLSPVLHSASPIIDLIESSKNESDEEEQDENAGEEPSEQKNLDSVETEVTQENLTVDELNEAAYTLFLSEGEIESIADENALVDATVNYENAATGEEEFLTATESDEWLIVI
jgi:hypothetical protein